MRLNVFKYVCPSACLLALFALSISPCIAQDTPDYKKVIADYIEATGGEMAHKEIESIVAKGKISLAEAGIEGEMTVMQTANKGAMKMTMAGIGEERGGYDGETAWTISEMTGPQILEGEQKDQMLMQMNLSPMLNIDEIFDSVSCTGVEEFNGEDCYVIEAKKEGQETVYHYFFVESKLQAGTMMTVANPMGKMEVISKLSDYREVGGVKMPFHTAAELPQGMTLETVMDSIEVNTKMDAAVFELPDEIKELKEEN